MSIRHQATDVVLHRDVPDWIRQLDNGDPTDYCDMVTGTTASPVELSPEELVGIVLRPAELRMRLLLNVVAVTHRVVLGFRPPRNASRDLLHGWRIAARGDNWLRLEAASGLLSGRIVLHREGRTLSFATFVHFERPMATSVWRVVAPLHRLVAVVLARRAVRTTDVRAARRTPSARTSS